ncbi:MAG: MFS transporter [Chloroflexi bacterium]|nr:MFS transporter [Chloroflexota bacterium]
MASRDPGGNVGGPPALQIERPAAGTVASGRPTAEWMLLAMAALATVLAPLNSTMIVVALPRVMVDFGADLSTVNWLVTGYLICMAALQPVAGALGDRLGRRGLIVGGLVTFGLASVGAALAPTLPVLLVCRLLQGVAGALALPNAAALVRATVPAERRAASFGLIGSVAGLAAAVGPLTGGLALQLADWRAIFLVNVPLVVGALALATRVSQPPRGRSAGPIDLAGAFVLGVALILAAVLLMGTRGPLALSPAIGWPVLFGLAGLLAWHEARHPAPVLPWRLLANRGFAAAASAVATSNLAMYVTLLVLPLLLSQRADSTALLIGGLMTVLSAAMALATPFGGRLADRVGRRWPAVIGLTLLTVGLLPFAVIGASIAVVPAGLGLLVAGVGLGLASASLQTAAVEAVGPESAGIAAGLFSTARYLGSIVGSSLMAGLLASAGGYTVIFIVVVLAAALSAFVSFGLRDR